jgi:hypothetical protein
MVGELIGGVGVCALSAEAHVREPKVISTMMLLVLFIEILVSVWIVRRAVGCYERRVMVARTPHLFSDRRAQFGRISLQITTRFGYNPRQPIPPFPGLWSS